MFPYRGTRVVRKSQVCPAAVERFADPGFHEYLLKILITFQFAGALRVWWMIGGRKGEPGGEMVPACIQT